MKQTSPTPMLKYIRKLCYSRKQTLLQASAKLASICLDQHFPYLETNRFLRILNLTFMWESRLHYCSICHDLPICLHWFQFYYILVRLSNFYLRLCSLAFNICIALVYKLKVCMNYYKNVSKEHMNKLIPTHRWTLLVGIVSVIH